MSKFAPEISLATSPQLQTPDLEALRDWARTHRVEEIECVTPD
ncbi:MAG: glutamine synthetase, partial [Paracoccaceae bacterium]